MASKDPTTAPPSNPRPRQRPNPIVRVALRYSLSEKEYQLLHRVVLKRSPNAVRRRAPTTQEYRALVEGSGGDDYNAAAVRDSLRVLLASQAGLKIWEWISSRFLSRRKDQSVTKSRSTSILGSPNLRLSVSLSLILFLHRLLYRFFSRLRTNLLAKDAAPFRRRNPRISRSLTSRLAPAVGASLAGFALGVYPADQLRITVAIYVGTRSLEFLYSALEANGWFARRPSWWGSWMLVPVATGQLLHAFVFDRDCFPKAYGDFILNHTPNYVQKRPLAYPPSLPWPSTYQIVDSLAEMSRLNWPPFVSPILFPNKPSTLPSTLSVLAPVTAPAHPSHTSLSCATLHPSDPSCIRTVTNFSLNALPSTAKFFAAIYTFFALPRCRRLYADPVKELRRILTQVIRATAFVTGSIGTSWASICLFQTLFPRTFLPSSRWFLGGFLGGLWAFANRQTGRARFMYSVRMSVDSTWKVGRKRGWWKGVRGGDALLFVVGLALTNAVYESRREAVDPTVARGLGWLRGEDFFSLGDESSGDKQEGKRSA